MSTHIFGPLIEAMSAASNWHPENAKSVLAWYEGLAALEQAHAAMLRAHGRAVTEEFYMDPAAGAYASELGDQFGRYGDSVGNAAAVFHRVHAEDIRRITEPAPNQAKWDIGANRD